MESLLTSNDSSGCCPSNEVVQWAYPDTLLAKFYFQKINRPFFEKWMEVYEHGETGLFRTCKILAYYA